ncbi:MAG: threo-3-hydroxy-L-aspartate ammonia-lyase [Frankiaceae bacterium]|nr:threo-3-hydroxy-L-aspartate ammonia-lyase [Frankiaceae bacterium]
MLYGMTTTLDDVRAAAARIAGDVHRTPLLSATSLGERYGVRLRVKAEVFQRTGSFKIRGALNAVRQLSDEQRAKGLVAISAGNHAAALAYAARASKATATIVMPHTANAAKIAATDAYGGEVVLTDQPLLDTLAQVTAERGGPTLVHPFDDPNVVAGAGTVGLEILEDGPPPDVVVVQAGGGGLLSGVATVVKALHPDTQVIGVEPEGADVISRSLAAGEPVGMVPVSVADGLCSPIGGTVTLPIIREKVDRVVRVPDDAIRQAMREMVERTKLVVEPAGAAGLAPFVAGLLDLPRGADVVLIATGANIDATLLATLLAP